LHGICTRLLERFLMMIWINNEYRLYAVLNDKRRTYYWGFELLGVPPNIIRRDGGAKVVTVRRSTVLKLVLQCLVYLQLSDTEIAITRPDVSRHVI
jgi:hypothetical protein